MSARLGIWNFLALLRPRWGIRGSLFAAFAVIAGMAIVISAGAGMVLAQAQRAAAPAVRRTPKPWRRARLGALGRSALGQSPIAPGRDASIPPNE